MNILLANKFLDFLTDTIAETKIPIWVALVAATVLIIIIATIILVCVNKNSKKKAKAEQATTSVAPLDLDAKTHDQQDEIAFEEVNEPFEIEDLADETAITAPVAEVKEVLPIQEKQETFSAPIKEEPIAEVAHAETAPIAEEIVVKPIISQQPVEEKVILPERGIDTTENKIIAKPLAKPMIKPTEETDKTEVAKPIAKPVAKPVVKKEAPKAEPAKAVKPIAKPVVKAEPKKETVKEAEIKVLDDEKETFGKYVIRNTAKTPDRPFTFELVANNGQLLFESEPFKQKPRQASIDAFKRHVKEGTFVVDEDKQGTFRYKLYSNKNMLIGVGETYKTKASCESSIESVKRFSESATIVEDKTL